MRKYLKTSKKRDCGKISPNSKKYEKQKCKVKERKEKGKLHIYCLHYI